MTVRICLALDPGPTKTGWSLACREGQQRVIFLAGGLVASDPDSLEVLIQGRDEGPDFFVAVESPSGFIFDHVRGAELLKTAKVAERCEMIARSEGYVIFSMPAQTWRRRLGIGGLGIPNDRTVKTALRILVQDFPKRSSTHVRDALGLAVVALLGADRPVFQLPPPSVLPPPYRPASRRR